MTLRERLQLGARKRSLQAQQRAETVRRLLAEGECIKRAAFKAGVAVRTARRYRRMGA